MARHGSTRAGRWPVQLRFDCGLTGEEYVTQKAWRNASLPFCPLHPRGGCGYTRHGTYERLSPPGTLIARWATALSACCPIASQHASPAPWWKWRRQSPKSNKQATWRQPAQACASISNCPAHSAGRDGAFRWSRRF